MGSLFLVFALVLYLTVVGRALICLLRPRLGILRSWLLAPPTGLAILIVALTRLSVWGLPVQTSGRPLLLGLLVVAAAILGWRRPALPWRQLAPFCGIAIFGVCYVGWPALRFGFDWISYGNDDMPNYVLAAERFLRHGYYDLPLQSDLEGRDYSQHYWFMHALQQIRPGAELTIAWIEAITGLSGVQVFMPAILALGLVQLFAMGSVALHHGRHRPVALLAFGLFAASPLFGFGILYQLAAQVGGMAILLAAAAVLIPGKRPNRGMLLLGGLLAGALAIFYPEVSPFLALGVLLHGFRLAWRDPARGWRFAVFIAGAVTLAFLIIGTNTYEFFNTLVRQTLGPAGFHAIKEATDPDSRLVLFPWTLVPSFVPMLFGLHPFAVVGVDPWISLAILAGFGLLCYFLRRTFRNFQAAMPVGYLGLVMILLGVFLFAKSKDFGLFKLAMYVQPVIAICLAQGLGPFLCARPAALRRGARWGLGLFLLATAYPEFFYTRASLGTYGGGLTEVVDGSLYGATFNPPRNLDYQGIESDISNVVIAKLLSLGTRGIDTRFLSRSYMDNIANIGVLQFLRARHPDFGPDGRIVQNLSPLRFLLPREIMQGDIPDYRVAAVHKSGDTWTDNGSQHLAYNDRLFVAVRTPLDHFNKANPGDGWTTQHIFQYKLESQLTDRLVFIHSQLSPHYYSAGRFHAAFFQRELEPITKHRAMEIYFHGTGQYNLFRIIHPSPRLRLLIDFTCTDLGAGRSKLPARAVVMGDEDSPIPFIGYGSARVATEIIRPAYVEQEAYITLNFNAAPAVIAKAKSGLMRLYGLGVELDDRRLVGFTRDISVLTDEQYRALSRPTRISSFPDDLARYPGLEYSGLYEDGWISEDSRFKLGAAHPGQALRFSGYVPDLARFHAQGIDLTISINDQPATTAHLLPGEFSLSRPIRDPAASTVIFLHFSDSGTFDSGTDLRPVSAFVREISIGNNPDRGAAR